VLVNPITAAADFSGEHNPNGPWSYGYLKPGDQPIPILLHYLKEQPPFETPYLTVRSAVSAIRFPRMGEILNDRHTYHRVPHSAGDIDYLREKINVDGMIPEVIDQALFSF